MSYRLIAPQVPPPLDDSHIQERLRAAGYSIEMGEKGEGYRRLIHQSGDLQEMEWLFDESILRLCQNAQIRKGYAYTWGELKGIAHPQTPEFYTQFQVMLENRLFFRGYKFTCPYCQINSWYDYIYDPMSCNTCAAIFQPPLEVPFAFRPSPLLSENLKNGAITPLLFLHQLRSVSQEAIWQANYILSKAGQRVEVDLITLIGDVLTVVECKDAFSDDLEAQLEGVLALAHDIGAEAFILASLQEENPLPAFFAAEDDKLLRRWMGQKALLGSLAYWKK